MVTVSPKRLSGHWKAGYALDLHTVSAEFLGYNEFGHPQFHTNYTAMGGLLHRLKYQSDTATIPAILETAVGFIRAQLWRIDLVVPVPPSNTRTFQPVLALAESISKTLGIPYCGDCVLKVHETPQLKNIYDLSERSKVLKDAFTVSKTAMVRKNVLLFDDLYRSGATLQAVACALVENAGIQGLYVLTLTMARKRR